MKKYWHVFYIILILLLIIFSVVFFSLSEKSLEDFGNFGDGLGGIVGVLIGGFTAYFVYETYKAQKDEITRLTNDSDNKILLEMLITVLLPQIQASLDKVFTKTGFSLAKIVELCTHLATAEGVETLQRVISSHSDFVTGDHAFMCKSDIVSLLQDLITNYDFTKAKIAECKTSQHKKDCFFLLEQVISEKEIEIIRNHVCARGVLQNNSCPPAKNMLSS